MSQISRRHKIYIAILTLFFCTSVVLYLADNSNGYSREQKYEELNLKVLSQTALATNVSLKNLQDYLKSRKGTYSFVILNLDTNETYTYNEKQPYYAASLYKIPIAIAALKEVEKGNLSMNSLYSYYPQDFADGTGILVQNKFGTNFTLEKLLNTLIKDSDNVSQNILLRTLPNNSIKEAFSIVSQNNYLNDNIATAEEINNYFKVIYDGNYLNNEDKAYLLDLLSNTSFDDRINRYLNPGITFSHKVGSWPGNYHDCGLAFTKSSTYTLCLMSGNADYAEFIDVSKRIASFFNTVESL